MLKGKKESSPQRRACQVVTQYQTISVENIQTSNIIQREHTYVFSNMYVCVCVKIIKEKEAIHLKENKEEETWEDFEGGKGGGNDKL